MRAEALEAAGQLGGGPGVGERQALEARAADLDQPDPLLGHEAAEPVAPQPHPDPAPERVERALPEAGNPRMRVVSVTRYPAASARIADHGLQLARHARREIVAGRRLVPHLVGHRFEEGLHARAGPQLLVQDPARDPRHVDGEAGGVEPRAERRVREIDRVEDGLAVLHHHQQVVRAVPVVHEPEPGRRRDLRGERSEQARLRRLAPLREPARERDRVLQPAREEQHAREPEGAALERRAQAGERASAPRRERDADAILANPGMLGEPAEPELARERRVAQLLDRDRPELGILGSVHAAPVGGIHLPGRSPRDDRLETGAQIVGLLAQGRRRLQPAQPLGPRRRQRRVIPHRA